MTMAQQSSVAHRAFAIAPERNHEVSSPTASSSGESPRWRLLIADDDAAVRAFLSLALQTQFDVVGLAADGEEAIAIAASARPDAALIDVQMPKGGGLHAVKGILGTSPETAIVMLSADEAESSVRELLAAGAIAYCRKGTPPADLARSLAESIKVRLTERGNSPALA